jgi:hypothetical protein
LYKNFILLFLPYVLLLISVNSPQEGQVIIIGNFSFWLIIQFITIYLFWKIKSDFIAPVITLKYTIFGWYFTYLAFEILRGIIISSSYWDYKFLIKNSLALSIPIVAYSADKIFLLKKIFEFYIFKTTPLILICILLFPSSTYGDFLAPYSFLFIFFPLLPKKWKLIYIIILAFLIYSDLGARSSIIKMSISFLLSLLYYFKLYVPNKILNNFRLLLLMSPLIFIALGSLGKFNIFIPFGSNQLEIIDQKRNSKGEFIEENLIADTRTILYLEVLNSTNETNSWFFGNSPARGNKSSLFGDGDLTKRKERNGNEIGMLNYFTWLGLFGTILIFLLFYQSSNLAINFSNNFIIKLVGIYISFRFAYGWVEDINNFTINNIYIWIFIGIGFSEKFRNMTNRQIKNWVLSIFEPNFNFKINTKSFRFPKTLY